MLQGGKPAPRISPDLEVLRHHPHLLLDYLRRTLLLEVSKHKGAHFEGLAAAGRAAKPVIGSKLATKLRMIDESFNLVRHLSPEPISIFVAGLQGAFVSGRTDHCSPPSSEAASCSSSCNWTDAASPSDPCLVYKELKPDKLDVWIAKEVEADLEEIFGSIPADCQVIMPLTLPPPPAPPPFASMIYSEDLESFRGNLYLEETAAVRPNIVARPPRINVECNPNDFFFVLEEVDLSIRVDNIAVDQGMHMTANPMCADHAKGTGRRSAGPESVAEDFAADIGVAKESGNLFIQVDNIAVDQGMQTVAGKVAADNGVANKSDGVAKKSGNVAVDHSAANNDVAKKSGNDRFKHDWADLCDDEAGAYQGGADTAAGADRSFHDKTCYDVPVDYQILHLLSSKPINNATRRSKLFNALSHASAFKADKQASAAGNFAADNGVAKKSGNLSIQVDQVAVDQGMQMTAGTVAQVEEPAAFVLDRSDMAGQFQRLLAEAMRLTTLKIEGGGGLK